MTSIQLSYGNGTLLLEGELSGEPPVGFQYDPRVSAYRAPADCYREAFAQLHLEYGPKLVDKARGYFPLEISFRGNRTPYHYQKEAAEAWHKGGRRGLIVLPTGSGKTFVAEMIIDTVCRSTLIVVPTLDLMNQWYTRLLASFEITEVGLIGGGYYDVQDLTVTTYDSFSIHAEKLGDRFGFLIFDECHHLPGPSYSLSSQCYLAPFRLGLTATPEREEGLGVYQRIVGDLLYRREIKELAGSHLAQYHTEKIKVPLSSTERENYENARGIYLGFLRSHRIRMGSREGWRNFIQQSSRSRAGREAMKSYRRQRDIAMACSGKLDLLEILLSQHAEDRTLVFVNSNQAVYEIASQFLIPAITHQTPIKERREILEGLRSGRFRAVVTNRVLNEGVDIPTANVAVVLSGSGAVREHVQRLGRILRRAEGKQAVLYEVLAADTMETQMSKRRREHDAYR